MNLKKLYKERYASKEKSDNLRGPLPLPVNAEVEVDLIGADFITADNILVFSGPPLQSMALNRPDLVKTIGLLVNFSFAHNKMNVPVRELNVKEYCKVPGVLGYSIQLSRILNGHNSVLYSIYRWLEVMLRDMINTAKAKEIDMKTYPFQFTLPIFVDYAADKYKGENKFDFIDLPGYFTDRADTSEIPRSSKAFSNNISSRHYNSLASEYFNTPFGLMVLELDGYNYISSALYCENCLVDNLSQSITPQGMLTENLAITPKNIKPLDPAIKINLDSTRTLFKSKPEIKEQDKSKSLDGQRIEVMHLA